MPRAKRIVYYTMIEDGVITFSGTIKDAVDSGRAKNSHSFRSIIQDKKNFGADRSNTRIFVTKKPFDEKCIENLKQPMCLLSAACNVYTEGNDAPCCKYCAFRKGCRDKCRNKEEKCGCQYTRKNRQYGSNLQKW